MNQQTNKPTNERAATAQSGYHAGNAGGSCIVAEKAAVKNTVVNRVDKPPTENGANSARNGSMETQQTHRFYLPDGFTRHCDQCRAAYVAKRDTSRYCCGACRVAAHRARHEAEAGKGQARAAVAVAWLAVIIFAAWFLAPLVSDLAAMRPRLAQGAAAAVNQAAPIAPAAVIVATPTLAPAAMPTDQAAAAVPDIAVTFTDSTGCQDCGTVIPAPWQVTPATPSPITGADLLRIEAGGRVWELTPARLVDCINAQQNDQPTGPTCPPNAATYAGMLGQGR